MEIQNKRIPDGEFEKLRQEVLATWPTGKDVNVEEAVAYQKAIPESRRFGKKLLDAKKEGRTLIQPRAGVPVVEEHIKLLQYLEKYGEADLLPSTIDSYTRQNRYEDAENGIAASIKEGRALMNGFPAVNHGVAKCRQVTESVAHRDHPGRWLHQLRRRRYLLQPALLQERSHGAHHPRLAVRRPSDRYVRGDGCFHQP